MNSRFNFVGTPYITKAGLVKTKTYTDKNGNERKLLSLNFGIKESNNNIGYVEAFDSERELIYTTDKDNQKFTVNWNDRFEDIVVDGTANYRKYIVDLGDGYGRKEFITTYDMIEYLGANLPSFNGKVMVTGDFSMDWYPKTGTYYDKFKVRGVYKVPDEAKNKLAMSIDLFYNNECVDKNDYATKKCIYVNGYVQQYINKDEGNKYVPISLCFNSSKYDLTNEKHKKILAHKLKYVDVQDNTYQHILWDVMLINGVEEATFDESMLTDAQKEQIELGIKQLNDFKPRGNIVGSRKKEFRLFEPKLDGDFANGLVDTGMTQSEFNGCIHQPMGYIPVEETSKKTDAFVADVDDSDLF